ncbi:MAG TPA: DUF3159 domain-containing protein [Jiangellaceae bacterium]|nr:DUF3159 domain-containing protein [Jiangellaceae bacterium]
MLRPSLAGSGTFGPRVRDDRPQCHLGTAAGFVLLQLLANGASALAWAVSIVIRWPLLGVVVGLILGQRGTWRRDPALLRAYGRASWVWTATFVLRLLAFFPLWLGGQVVALGAARVALSWPHVAACIRIAVSWVVIQRSLPPDHPGLRTPVPAATGGRSYPGATRRTGPRHDISET